MPHPVPIIARHEMNQLAMVFVITRQTRSGLQQLHSAGITELLSGQRQRSTPVLRLLIQVERQADEHCSDFGAVASGTRIAVEVCVQHFGVAMLLNPVSRFQVLQCQSQPVFDVLVSHCHHHRGNPDAEV